MRTRAAPGPMTLALAISLAGLVLALPAAATVPGVADAGPLPAVPSGPGGAPAPGSNPSPGLPPPEQAPGPEPGFAQEVRRTFQQELVVYGLAALAVTGVGVFGFAFVTRYIPPEEALKNPQRAMLYGFVRGNPGVHLKRLSDEFHMKTSSILWHMRKLDAAELVRSERANGFRVFYPTAGGVEARNVGRAVTAMQNPNAYQVFAALDARPAAAPTSAQLAESLRMHAGTARWHLKKLKEFGLVEEVPGPEGARYLPTPLGRKAFQSLSGTSNGASPGGVPATA